MTHPTDPDFTTRGHAAVEAARPIVCDLQRLLEEPHPHSALLVTVSVDAAHAALRAARYLSPGSPLARPEGVPRDTLATITRLHAVADNAATLRAGELTQVLPSRRTVSRELIEVYWTARQALTGLGSAERWYTVSGYLGPGFAPVVTAIAEGKHALTTCAASRGWYVSLVAHSPEAASASAVATLRAVS